MDWFSFGIGVLTGYAALVALWLAVVFFAWATDRNIGLSGCYVCDRSPVCEIGERTKLGLWPARTWHDQVLSRMPAHRRAWDAHKWNPKNHWCTRQGEPR